MPERPDSELRVEVLLGPEQEWIDHARGALEFDRPFLTPHIEMALGSDTHRVRLGDDPFEWPWVWKSVAQPLNQVLTDISGDRESVDSLRALMIAFDRNGLVSVEAGRRGHDPGPSWVEPDTRLQAALLGTATSAHRSGPFVTLLIHLLAHGSRANSRWAPRVTMPVLLHHETNADNATGEVGTLTLSAWPGGPPGLHPDPRLMTFSTADDQVHLSLQHAMAASEHASSGTCVTWAVSAADGAPVRRLEGESLGAAAALLLRELTPRRTNIGRIAWRLRPRRLRPDWTVTAGLRGADLTRVTHYDSKLDAVAALAKPLHVAVAPRPKDANSMVDPVLLTRDRLGLDVKLIATINDLAATTRTLNRTFIGGLVGAIMIVAALGGVGTWARNAIAAANDAAARRSTAAELMQQSRDLVGRDPRLAALTALAADDLDPSPRTQQLMSEVLSSNEAVSGSALVSTSYVVETEISNNTLLVLDGDDRVTAWELPSFTPLGTVAEGVRAMGTDGPADVVLVSGSTMHFFQAADGYRPQEVKTVETDLDPETALLGPHSSGRAGVVLLNEDLEGVYYDMSLSEPYSFTIAGDPALEADPGRRSLAAVAATSGTFGYTDTPEGRYEAAGIGVATSARQIVDVSVSLRYGSPPRPKVEVRSVMYSREARAAVRAIAHGPNNTVLLGTDRGIQQWDPTLYETREFPYGGWAEQVDAIHTENDSVVVMGKQRIAFFREPADDRPRLEPTIVELQGSVFTSVESAQISRVGRVSSTRYFAGREDGTVIMLDPDGSRFGPGTVGGSNVQRFTPTGHMLLTSGPSPQSTDAIQTVAVPSPEPDDVDDVPAPDPYEQTYTLPSINGFKPYLNDAAATDDWVVAAGRRADGFGAIWAWDLSGGNYAVPHEISFGNGESGVDPVPDIVTQIDFADEGRQIVAFNSAKGELGFWTVGDWKQVGTVNFSVPDDFEDSRAMGAVVSDDGRTVAVRDTPTSIQIVDVATHEATTTVRMPNADFGALAISPEGRRIAVVDRMRTVRIIDVTVGEGRVLVSDQQDAVVNALAWDPTEERLAMAMATASAVVLADIHSLDPLGPAWSPGDGYRVVDVTWSPDGRHLSVGTFQSEGDSPVNGDTHILDPTTLTWRKQLCAMTTSNFTRDEWRELSNSDLPRPNSCNWSGSAAPRREPQKPSASPTAPRTGDLRMIDLMAAAPVPRMCQHDAGTLVLGSLPNQPPGTGYVSLSKSAYGDLTGDGIDDATAIVECTAGGVSWAPTVVLYARGRDGGATLLGSIVVDDPAIVGAEGSSRPVVTSIEIVDGEVHAEVLATTGGDASCCGSLPIDVSLRAEESGLKVVRVVRHHDLEVLNKLVFGVISEISTGIDFNGTPLVLRDAIEEFANSNIGVEAGTCFVRAELAPELAARLTEAGLDSDDESRFCTITAAAGEKVPPLLVQLVSRQDGRWRAEMLVP